MSFVSLEFFVFLAVVFTAYHLTGSIRLQNWLIVVASLVFYAFWDWRFLALLIGNAYLSYAAAILIERAQSQSRKRLFLWSTIAIVLITLGFFKYFNFFVDSAVEAAKALGFELHGSSLQIILPLGISFMTFQGLSYVIDVYRGEHAAERSFVNVLAFKTFFPQLVAGPIERADHLLDQFKRPRILTEEKVRRAVWLMIYGFAMKIVIADSMAAIVNSQFTEAQVFGWSTVLSTVAFGLQIYADFCGYSLIAKGAALLFGFDLVWNFRFPYWSISISDFWRRWHVSLSSWLRDYLYIPLGGNRRGKVFAARNMMITMILGGLWHGASWNFVLWGLLHGLALGVWRYSPAPTLPTTLPGKLIGWFVTMAIVLIGWFLFRATTWPVAHAMLTALSVWEWVPAHTAMIKAIVAVVVPMAILEWALLRRGDYFLVEASPAIAYPVYSALTLAIFAMAGTYQATFIYFQF